MVESLAFIAGLVGFELVTARFAKSTRDGEDWINQNDKPHLPVNV